MRGECCIGLCVHPLQLHSKGWEQNFAISVFELKALACFGKRSDKIIQMDQVKKNSKNHAMIPEKFQACVLLSRHICVKMTFCFRAARPHRSQRQSLSGPWCLVPGGCLGSAGIPWMCWEVAWVLFLTSFLVLWTDALLRKPIAA